MCCSFKGANAFDKEICQSIVDSVEKYEKQSNVTINKIAVDYSYQGLFDMEKIAKFRKIAISRSYVSSGLPINSIIELYCEREFESVYIEPEEFKQYFDNSGDETLDNQNGICFVDDIVLVNL